MWWAAVGGQPLHHSALPLEAAQHPDEHYEQPPALQPALPASHSGWYVVWQTLVVPPSPWQPQGPQQPRQRHPTLQHPLRQTSRQPCLSTQFAAGPLLPPEWVGSCRPYSIPPLVAVPWARHLRQGRHGWLQSRHFEQLRRQRRPLELWTTHRQLQTPLELEAEKMGALRRVCIDLLVTGSGEQH